MPQQVGFDSYLICATPRTGSTLLCGLMESTGVAERPESYFRREDLDAYADNWGVPRAADGPIDDVFVRAAVAAGSTANGIFSARIMWNTMTELTNALAAITSDPTYSELELLTRTFGRTLFVHLRRDDVVAQAVSWARAEHTHFWQPEEELTPGGQDPHFDRDLISRLAQTIDEHEAGWRAWFAEQGVVPHEIEYEDLAADPIGVTRGALDFLGLDLPADRTIVARHRRQADDLNADWTTRFRSGTAVSARWPPRWR